MLKIAACSTLTLPAQEAITDVIALRKHYGAPTIRRINRFTDLALIGAHRAISALTQPLPADTAVYLLSDAPNLSDSLRVIRAAVQHHKPPSPFDFMNTAANMAGFYVAQHFGLSGTQLSLHRSGGGLSAALELLTLPSAPTRALVGFVEEVDWPLSEHRLRMGLAADGQFAECSHWLLFDAETPNPIAQLALAPPTAAEAWPSLAASGHYCAGDAMGALCRSVLQRGGTHLWAFRRSGDECFIQLGTDAH